MQSQGEGRIFCPFGIALAGTANALLPDDVAEAVPYVLTSAAHLAVDELTLSP